MNTPDHLNWVFIVDRVGEIEKIKYQAELKAFEKSSKRSDEFWSGRTSQNNVVIFPKENYNVGTFVDVVIKEATSATLKGNAIAISSNI